ncbi:hypothetical protein [Hymenobacter crusticola]|uniref:Uncharacterized protein n=1 Tax=Hymenobacter crusticola TaxID=1770526 RepID=A0A243W4T6_9BACT|nr:hypothetical protein [Hymenobacter crusticola]OUJ67352.1 hypothetical protein BXP70_28910 [Hymenobacter crusticola]
MSTASLPTFLQFGTHGECLLNTTQIRAVTRTRLPVTAANREEFTGSISPEGQVHLLQVEFLDGEQITFTCTSQAVQQQMLLQLGKALQAHVILGAEEGATSTRIS